MYDNSFALNSRELFFFREEAAILDFTGIATIEEPVTENRGCSALITCQIVENNG